MNLTPQQREERRQWVGASEVAAILGVSPYGTAWEVQQSKLGWLDDWKGSAATEAGARLESAILDHAESELGPLLRDELRIVPGLPIRARCDAVVADTRLPVEAKTSGITGPLYGDWGDAGTDVVPMQYIVQCHVQMMATDAELCHLFALLGGRGFVRYDIVRSPVVSDLIADHVPKWWQRHIVDREPCDIEPPPPLEVVKRLLKVPDKVIDVGDDALALCERWEQLKRRRKVIEKAIEEQQSRIHLAIGDAEEALLPDGRRITHYEQTRREHICKESTFRVLRITKGDR